MARPPNPMDTVLRFGVTPIIYDYPGEPDGRCRAVWIQVHTEGPVVGREASAWAGRTSHDMLLFETRNLLTPHELQEYDKTLSARKVIRLPMYDRFFQSDVPCADHGLHPGEDNVIGLEGETIEMTIRENEHHQLEVEPNLTTEGWLNYGIDLFLRKLRKPQAVAHWEHRMWDMVTLLCPKLARSVEAEINKAKTEHCHPEMDLLSAPREMWRLVRPNKPNQREEILKSLLYDNSIYTKAQIAIILGDTDLRVRTWEERADGSVLAILPPAKDVTVDRLLKAAKLAPIFKTYFAARQITHLLLPYVISRYKAQQRYKDVAEELMDYGIEVPLLPVIHRSPRLTRPPSAPL